MAWDLRRGEVMEWLLQPYSVEEFRDRYYEREPLFIKRAIRHYYDCIGSLAGVERLLTDTELTAQDLLVIKDGAPIRADSYTISAPRADREGGNRTTTQIVDPLAVLSLFKHGCTLTFERLQFYSGPVEALLRELSAFFRHGVYAGMFLTPPQSAGFTTHFDTHDTMMMQIEGRKHWRIFAPTIELPLKGTRCPSPCEPGPLLMEIELEAGDFLYLPRGTYHEGKASAGEHSLHITVGLNPVRWNTVLSEALDEVVRNHVALRQSAAMPLEEGIVAELAQVAFSTTNLYNVRARLESKFCANASNELRPDVTGQFCALLDSSALTESSIVALRPGTPYTVTQADNRVLVRSYGKELLLPEAALGVLEGLMASRSARVGDLIEGCGATLDLIRRLMRAGLLVLCAAQKKPANGAVYATASAPDISGTN